MMRWVALCLSIASTVALIAPARAGELSGPGRFCGYSPIIDLMPGERVVTGQGGMHAGKFSWHGRFGTMEVTGVGWGSKPGGRAMKQLTSRGHQRFALTTSRGVYRVAIWNGRQGTAYFDSAAPFTAAQLAAVDRVDLFQEGEQPDGCSLRTAFSWDSK